MPRPYLQLCIDSVRDGQGTSGSGLHGALSNDNTNSLSISASVASHPSRENAKGEREERQP